MDFKISNFDLSDILLNGKYQLFTQSVQSIWNNGYLVTKIDKTVNRPGGRYTPTGVKEGFVYKCIFKHVLCESCLFIN